MISISNSTLLHLKIEKGKNLMKAPYTLVILILVNIFFLQMLSKSSRLTPTKSPKMLQQRHVNQSEVFRRVQYLLAS